LNLEETGKFVFCCLASNSWEKGEWDNCIYKHTCTCTHTLYTLYTLCYV